MAVTHFLTSRADGRRLYSGGTAYFAQEFPFSNHIMNAKVTVLRLTGVIVHVEDIAMCSRQDRSVRKEEVWLSTFEAVQQSLR